MTCTQFRALCSDETAAPHLATEGVRVAHAHFLGCASCRLWLEEEAAMASARDPASDEEAERWAECMAKAYREAAGGNDLG